jgi:hypothetical protein
MRISTRAKFTIILALHCYLPGLAGAAEPASNTWQMTRLFQPTQADLNRETKGRIMIYDGLTDKTVERALDDQFDRVETMMFTRVVVTDDSGEPVRDTDNGEIVTEEDGCD